MNDTIFMCFLSFLTLCMAVGTCSDYDHEKRIYIGIGPFTFAWFVALIVIFSLGYKL